jgi:membrane protein
LALELLDVLDKRRHSALHAEHASGLAAALRVDLLQLEPVLQALLALNWIGQLADQEGDTEPRYVLLADPDRTVLEPLVSKLLLEPSAATAKLNARAGWAQTSLRSVLA